MTAESINSSFSILHSSLSSEFLLAQHHAPRVDDDGGADPTVVFVEEEGEVVLILPVEVLLVGHVAVVVALDEQGVVHERNGEHHLARLVVGDAEGGGRAVVPHQPPGGHFGQGGRDGGGGARAVGLGLGSARGRVVGAVVQHLVGQQAVVVGHEAVGAGNVEGKPVGRHGRAVEVLQHHAHGLGVLHQRDVDVVRAVGVRQLHVRHQAVEGWRQLAGSGRRPVGMFALHGARQVAECRCAGLQRGHGVRLPFILQSAPGHVAPLVVERIEGHALHLSGKGVAVVQVVVVGEARAVVRRAVALIVHDAARGEQQGNEE